MGRVVLATMGSWGDIFPVIGLAKGLAEAGHDVRVAASPAYDELVQGEGLEFSGIGPALGFSDYARDPKILSGRLGGFVGFAHLFRRFIFPALDRYVDDLAASIRGADLLLAHPALIAAPVAAEHVGVRWGRPRPPIRVIRLLSEVIAQPNDSRATGSVLYGARRDLRVSVDLIEEMYEPAWFLVAAAPRNRTSPVRVSGPLPSPMDLIPVGRAPVRSRPVGEWSAPLARGPDRRPGWHVFWSHQDRVTGFSRRRQDEA